MTGQKIQAQADLVFCAAVQPAAVAKTGAGAAVDLIKGYCKDATTSATKAAIAEAEGSIDTDALASPSSQADLLRTMFCKNVNIILNPKAELQRIVDACKEDDGKKAATSGASFAGSMGSFDSATDEGISQMDLINTMNCNNAQALLEALAAEPETCD